MPETGELHWLLESGALSTQADKVVELAQPYSDAVTMHSCSYGFKDGRDVAYYLLRGALDIPVFDAPNCPERAVKWWPSSRFQKEEYGPTRKAKVMVIGKIPSKWEIERKASYRDDVGKLIVDVCKKIDLDCSDWYCTNAVRYIPPDGGKTLKAVHTENCQYMLAQEIALAQPDYILLFGADAVKALCGKKMTLANMRSQVRLMFGVEDLGKPLLAAEQVAKADYDKAIKVFATTSPLLIMREAGYLEGFEKDLEIFKNLTMSVSCAPTPIEQRDYRYVRSYAELKKTVDEVLALPNPVIAIDSEFGGDVYTGNLRTIQFSWKPETSCVCVFLEEHEALAQSIVERIKMIDELRRLCSNVGIIGHATRADAPWCENLGIPIMSRLVFDTMLADHILNENAEHGLEACTVRCTNMGRYDIPLSEWLKENGHNKAVLAKRGYLDIPNALLLPYAAQDADATFRVYLKHKATLQKPELASVARCFYEIVMPCNLPIYEIESAGLFVDRDRMEDLVWRFDAKKTALLSKVRETINRPNFNPRSTLQMRSLLFGSKEEGNLGLTPYKTTEKPARMWEDIQHLSENEKRRLNASTDMESLESVADQAEVAKILRDFKIIDQVQKSFLRLPYVDEEGEESYESGLVGAIDPDGRIRTRLSQMSETGRHKSYNPNLQNLPKKQDGQLIRIMGKGIDKIRSCFIASPGCVIIEADYKSAEIFTMGYLSNCLKLVQDAKGDLHARGAVTRFGCEKWSGYDEFEQPPGWWKDKYKSERVANKAIVFGIPYGRGAKAIARQIKKETNGAMQCDQPMAQNMINGFFGEYPEMEDYIAMCHGAVLNPGHLENPYGRRRRGVSQGDRSFIAAQQREFTNFPIQSTVADTLNRALYNLYMWRLIWPGLAVYKILVAIHDAVLLEVPGEFVDIVTQRVLPECMKHGAVIPSWTPIPNREPTPSFSLDIDIEVGIRWGEHCTPEELRCANVPEHTIERLTKKGG